MTQTSFSTFELAETVARAVTQCSYTIPTPVQQQALPIQLEGRDLMALAETGSGKTAAFVLPILNELAKAPKEPTSFEVFSLVLAPTRELAIQIDAEFAALSRNMNIRRAVVLGGVSKRPQIHALKRGVHVLVATPGRLLDHVAARHADLRSVKIFVLDEADRMFDMGFVRDIRKITALLPRQRRTAMFSATMPPEIKRLANELLTEPAHIDLSPKQLVVDRIDQKIMMIRVADKQSRLHTLLADPNCTRSIVFTRTKRGADRVTDRLGMAGIGAVAIHGNKAQNARQRALADFAAGHVKVLVATDIAARGIDVANVSHVINFDMPLEAETYVHRIGRTARKGESGIAISLCDPSERGEIAAIERLMKQKIEVVGDVGGAVIPAAEPRRQSGQQGRRGGGAAPAHGHAHHRKPNSDSQTRRNHPRDPQSRGRAAYDPLSASGTERTPDRAKPAPSRHDRAAQHHEQGGKRHGNGQQRPARTPNIDHSGSTSTGISHKAAPSLDATPASRMAAPKPHRETPNWNGQQPPKFLKRRGR